MYSLHCAIIKQINTDKLKDLLLVNGANEVEDAVDEEILDAEDLEDPMDVVNA